MLVETILFEQVQAILAKVQAKPNIDGVVAGDAEPYRLAYLLAARSAEAIERLRVSGKAPIARLHTMRA